MVQNENLERKLLLEAIQELVAGQYGIINGAKWASDNAQNIALDKLNKEEAEIPNDDKVNDTADKIKENAEFCIANYTAVNEALNEALKDELTPFELCGGEVKKIKTHAKKAIAKMNGAINRQRSSLYKAKVRQNFASKIDAYAQVIAKIEQFKGREGNTPREEKVSNSDAEAYEEATQKQVSDTFAYDDADKNAEDEFGNLNVYA